MWVNTYPTKLQPLYLLQKRALRICSFSWRQAHTKELFVKFNVLTVFQLNSYYCSILLFKHKQNMLHKSLSSMLTSNTTVHDHNTRSRNKYHLWTVNKNYSLFSFRHHAPVIWNNLPLEIKSLNSMNTFKRKLKSYLITSVWNFELLILLPCIVLWWVCAVMYF